MDKISNLFVVLFYLHYVVHVFSPIYNSTNLQPDSVTVVTYSLQPSELDVLIKTIFRPSLPINWHEGFGFILHLRSQQTPSADILFLVLYPT